MPRTRSLPVFPLTAEPVRPGVPPDVLPIRHEAEAAGPDDGLRIAVLTLGCDKNTVDSERMIGALVGHGARVTGDPDDADVVLVNTCGFIQEAKEQSIETILEACALKEEGALRAVVAVGCLVQRYKEDLVREIPEVDLFMGLTELSALVPELRRRGILAEEEPEAIPLLERPLRVLTGETPHTTYLKISEGCDHTCAFCAIPLMRGLHRSQPLEALVREAAALGEGGVREINVVSQDTTWYGRDLRRKDRSAPLLPELLRALLAGTEVPWYRLFYMYPSGITRELVELLASEERLLPYLDMPIQHGSDRVLERMRRPERRSTILERVRWLRAAVPDLTLRTTVIVGFPGESDRDFRDLLDLLEEIEFDRVGAFGYSSEEGTRAAELPDHVPDAVIAERLEELGERTREMSFDRNLALVGRRERALVDRLTPEDPDHAAVARIRAQALDVDGVTHLLRGTGAQALRPGDFVDVEVIDALDHDLIAEVRG